MNTVDTLKEQYQGKNVLVVGLGLLGGGLGIARFFAELGARVRVTDQKSEQELAPSIRALHGLSIEYTLGRHDVADFLWADIIFKGPFVQWSLPELMRATEKGTPIEMELSFFASVCPAPIIGITGTRGKSTTTSMVSHILLESGRTTHLAGSLPHLSTINLLKDVSPGDWVVMELPSWPLSGFHRKKISPHIGVFTNFYPDHLNYYSSMEEYFHDKTAIFKYQESKDYLVANGSLEPKLQGLGIKSAVHYFSANDYPELTLSVPGNHNRENAAAAIMAAICAGVGQSQAIRAVSSFTGLPYRLQTVRTHDGITVVNDTTSTTPVATLTALQTFSDRPVILIFGGKDKNLPYAELLPALENVKRITLLKGSFTDKIMPELTSRFPEKLSPIYTDLEEAYKDANNWARQMAAEKPVILFSPGATSFAMFNNEYHRGEAFNAIVYRS